MEKPHQNAYDEGLYSHPYISVIQISLDANRIKQISTNENTYEDVIELEAICDSTNENTYDNTIESHAKEVTSMCTYMLLVRKNKFYFFATVFSVLACIGLYFLMEIFKTEMNGETHPTKENIGITGRKYILFLENTEIKITSP